MTRSSVSVGIVGAGMLGLTLALRLREQGHDVTVLDAAAEAGGLAAPATIGRFTWDRFYHVILRSDKNLLSLLQDLDLRSELRWGATRTGFYIDRKLHSLSSTIDFLKFRPLSLGDKARLGATVLHAARVTDWKPLEAISAVDWLTRWSGRRTTERVWLPLLRAKLGDNYRLASAAFIWAIIARMYGARHSAMKRESFGYVNGGYATILSRLDQRLSALGVLLRYGASVEQVGEGPSGPTVSLRGGQMLGFDHVVLTVPAGRVADLCPGLSAAEQTRLCGVTYQGMVCAALILRRPLSEYYITNIADASIPFTAVIEMTALVDRERFGGHSLVYLPRYMTQADERWARRDEEILEEFLGALQRMHPQFEPDQVVAHRMSRAREVLAISTLEYSDRALPPLRTSLSRVFVVNSAQIANGTLNVNETIGLANAQANALDRCFREAAPALRSAGAS